MATESRVQRTVGAVLHSPFLYDATVWFALRGRESQLRKRLLDLSHLRSGESVLDVGCGTGTLAIHAKKIVGPTGKVFGVDPSPEMLARAYAKAARAGVELQLERAAAQALPFSDYSFDLVLSTMMLHHLGRTSRGELAVELRRVVKPGGRAFVVDFARTATRGGGLARHLRHRHGHVDLEEMRGLLDAAGFDSIESGAVGIANMHFVLATSPTTATPAVPDFRALRPQP